MTKLKCLAITTIVSIISVFGLTVYASTSETVYEQSLVSGLVDQYEGYEAPYISDSDYVSLSTGNVNVTEADISLPGKNGHDLSIIRTHYTNGAPGTYIGETSASTNANFKSEPAYPYTYTLDGTTYTVYVTFNREEEILDEFYSTETLLKNSSTDSKSQKYYKYNSIDATSGITLTRLKTTSPLQLYTSGSSFFLRGGNDIDIEIGYGWYVTMPKIQYQTVVSSSSIKKYTYLLTTESGESVTFKFERYKDDSSNWVYDEESCSVSNYEKGYSANVYNEAQTHSLGFSYMLELTDPNGVTYYFENAESCIAEAVVDRYNNAIYYTKNSDGSVTITDTYGRTISVSSSEVRVTAGSESRVVKYVISRTNTDRDPSGLLNCFSKYTLKVRKYNGSSYETTTYVSHKSGMDFSNGQRRFYDKIEEITTPSNAVMKYEYESEPSIKMYSWGTSSITTTHSDYHISKSTSYENDEEKLSKTYTLSQASSYEMLANARERKVSVKESYDDGTSKTTSYSFDCAGRLYEKSFSDGNKTYSEEYSYSYSPDGYRSEMTSANLVNMRKAYVKGVVTKYGSNVIDITYNELSDRQQPTYVLDGEKETTCTYDDTYGLLLTKTYKTDDDTTISIKNTRTTDGKGILYSRIYVNNSLKFTTTYTYNSDGTISKEVNKPASGTSRTTSYTYAYNTDGSYSVTSTVQNISDNDGNNISESVVQYYDGLGNLASVTDANGNTTSYTYDKTGRVTKQTNPDGTYSKIAYSSTKNSVTATDENGNVTTYDYTPLGNLDKIYLDNDESKVAASAVYDSHNRLVSETAYQSIGGKTVTQEYTYDLFDRTVSGTSYDNGTTLDTVNYEYSFGEGFATAESGTMTVPDGATKLLIYTCNTNNDDRSSLKIYINSSLYETVTTDRGRNMSATLIEVSDTDTIRIGYETSCKTYYKFLSDDDFSKNIDKLSGASQTVTATYTGDSTYVKPTVETLLDGFGNVVAQTYYKHGTTTILDKNTYKYDYAGNVLEELGGRTYTEGLGDYTTKTEYDYMGNPTKVYRADGTYMTMTYNGFGEMTASSDYLENSTTYTYDNLGRQIKTEAPFNDDATTSALTYYDGNGNVVKTKEQNNKSGADTSYSVTEYEYDSRDRLVTVKQNDGSRDIYTQYAYDNVGNLVKSVTGQTSKISDLYGTLPEESSYVTYEYDRYGNVIKTTNALGISETAEYNLVGLPTSVTTGNGTTTTYTYNAYGSILTETVGSDTITNTYSVNNMLKSVTGGKNASGGTGSVTYTYDNYGNVSKEVNNGVTNTYTYDADGNRKTMKSVLSGATTVSASYTYDTLNNLTNVSFSNGITSDYTYDANGNLLSEVNGGQSTTYMYNKAGLVTTVNNRSEEFDDGWWLIQGYAYTMSGDISRSVMMPYNPTTGAYRRTIIDYSYNDMGQLVYERDDYSSVATDYTYDTRGNRIQSISDDDYTVTDFTYNKANQLLSSYTTYYESESTTRKSYKYDKNGNCTVAGVNYYNGSTLARDYAKYYYYDKRDRMVEYEYLGANYTTGAETEKYYTYAYDGLGKRITKTDEYNENTTRYRWDGSEIIGESGYDTAVYYRGLNLIAHIKDGATSYYVYNAHGDTVGLTQGTEALKTNCAYSAFGEYSDLQGTPFRYNGQYYDTESGLYYLRNRYYDPTIGRFTQEDPVKSGLNWYAYCNNNPVKYSDPWGLYIVSKDAEEFCNYFIEMTGDSGFVIDGIKNNMSCIVWNEECSDKIGNGSETFFELLKVMINDDCQYVFSLSDNLEIANSSGSNLGVSIGVSDLDLSTSEGNQMLYSVIAHESAHSYACKKGYVNNIQYTFINDGFYYESEIKNFIENKYQEAFAITFEDVFRSEMGYASRSSVSDKLIEVNGYGQFPTFLTTNSNELFNGYVPSLSGQRVSDYVRAYIPRNYSSGFARYLVDVISRQSEERV